LPQSDELKATERVTEPIGAVPGPGPAPGTSASVPGEAELVGRDRGRERAVIYWVVLLLLLGGSFVIRNSPWHSGPELHTVMESIATLLAFLVGCLALVRFYSRKQATFLAIGTGFLGAGVLDLNHVILTTPQILARLTTTGQEVENLFAWSWTAERVFLSLFLFWSVLAWRKEARHGAGEAVHEGSVYATALVLTLVDLFFFQFYHLRNAHFVGLPMSRPAELLPAFLFAAAFFGLLMEGGWRRDTFEHWLLLSLLISAMTQAAFMSMSQHRFDAMFDAAHLLKIASYLAMLTGLLFSVYLTFRREGEVLGALTEANDALAREVSVRAQAQQALKEGRARIQDFLDNANDLIQTVAPDGRFLYVNSAWKRVLRYTDEDLERKSVFDIVHPAWVGRLKEEFKRVLSGAPARRFNVEFISADERVVILSGSAAAQFDRGLAVATQGIFRDVTEQRLAERQLAASKANLTALVENTGDAIWSVDRDHRLITFNSAFSLAIEAATGREPAVGQLPEETFSAEDVEWYRDVYDRALRGDRNVALRTDQVGGQLSYFELYANPIQGEEGTAGAVLFGKDVTPRVRAEEALRVAKEEAEAANKAKSDFLANMSHELRTPLNSVIGFTNILLKNKGGNLNDKDVGFLQRVLANGKHLLELINEVLDLAKVEAGRMELIIEPVDLRGLVVETVQQLEGQARVKDGNVVLIADAPEQVDAVETDSAKLKQVIINLVGNALKFTHEGSVTVRVDVAGDGRTPVAIAVEDTGIGIPPDRLEAIFEAFQQAEAGTARKYGGTGLGLAISRSICLLMGYDLMVESEMGKGSTFTIVMGERARKPLKEEAEEGEGEKEEAEEAAPAATREAAAPAPRMRDFQVLVVDDEKDSRVLMSHYLEEFGCRVITAGTGEEGIQAARDNKPDLITLDLMMPGMTGWEVLQKLKADPELRKIPVVVVSIVAGEGRGRLLGAVDLVTKPFDREDLLRVLWRNLVRKRGGRVLVVEDEESTRRLLEGYLHRFGLEVVTAGDGQAGLDAVRTEAPDAVLLDMIMPVMDGMTFLHNLRADPLYTGLPVIVLTGKELTHEEHKALSDMASGILQKGDELEPRLRETLSSLFALVPPEDVAS
jgi:PAS domain S-box-containing protein